jgi:hypothetical protein
MMNFAFSVQRSAFSVIAAIMTVATVFWVSSGSPAFAQCNDACGYFTPPRDSNGWTSIPDNEILVAHPVLYPVGSPGLMIFYVCSSTGNDMNDGLQESTAFATMDRAWQAVKASRVGSQWAAVNARIRVRRGSVLFGRIGPDNIHGEFGGAGANTPLVIQAWPVAPQGTIDDRPRFILPTNAQGEMTSFGVRFGGSECFAGYGGGWRGDIWLIGLNITAAKVDGKYEPWYTEPAIYASSGKGARLLVEDCYVHDMGALGKFSGNTGFPLRGITIRRNVVARTWQRFGGEDNSVNKFVSQRIKGEAIWVNNCEWVLIEDNSFIANGWNRSYSPLINGSCPMIAPKNYLSQGLYITEAAKHVTVQNNVIVEPAHAGIQSRGNYQRIHNNLILSAGWGIGLGHPMNQDGGPDATRLWRGECAYNVIINGANYDRFIPTYPNQPETKWEDVEIEGVGLGVGISLSRCQRFAAPNQPWQYVERPPGATQCYLYPASTVHHNLVFNNEDGKGGNFAGLYINDDKGVPPAQAAIDIGSYTAIVHDNVIANWTGAGAVGCFALNVMNERAETVNAMNPLFVIARNVFFQPDKTRFVANTRFNPPGGTWSINGVGNLYATGNENEALVYKVPPIIPGQTPFPQPAPYEGPMAQSRSWQQATSDASFSQLPSADYQSVFSGGGRTLREYMDQISLNYGNASREIEYARAFGEYCELQRRGDWDVARTAASVNAFLREGFDLPAEPVLNYPVATSGCCTP